MNPRSGAAPLALVALAAALALLAPVLAAATRGALPRTGATVSEAPQDPAAEALLDLRALARDPASGEAALLRERFADPALAPALLAIAADRAHELRAEAVFALRLVDTDEAARVLIAVAEGGETLAALALAGLRAMRCELARDYVSSLRDQP